MRQTMSKAALILFLYGILTLFGGVMGFVQARSYASLTMGIIFGLMLLGSSIALFKKKQSAIWVSLSLVFLLDAFFTYRFIQTLRFFPAGFFSILSLIVLIALASVLREKKR
jgi:uncharacterized membrane protein (UPF0136 family)